MKFKSFALSLLTGVATIGGGGLATDSAYAKAYPAVSESGVDYQALDAITGDAQTVIFGEDSHGMQAVHEAVPDMFRYLVEEKGFRVFVFEAQWGISEGLADFMASDRKELGGIESYWLNGAFASKPIGKMLVWIRDWNRAHPDDPIMISGYQPENPVMDFAGLFGWIDKVAGNDAQKLKQGVSACRASDAELYKTELDFIIAQSQLMKAAKPNYTPRESAECLSGLYDIRHYLADNESRVAANFGPEGRILAEVHLTSLIAYVGILRVLVDASIAAPDIPIASQSILQSFVYEAGDEARFHIYQKLRGLYFPNAKIFHWMHNWHSFRNASEAGEIEGQAGIPRTTVSIGERIAQEGGDSVKIILNSVPCGDTCVEPETSLETQVARYFGEKAGWIDFASSKDLPPAVLESQGSLYANHHKFGFSGIVLERQADGLFFIPETPKVGR